MTGFSIQKTFTTRIFVAATLFLLITSLAFTALSVRHQGDSLRESLVEEGELLAGILAYSTRLGVFSENVDLLSDPVEGVFRNQDVLAVAVYGSEGNLLYRKNKEKRGETPEQNMSTAASLDKVRHGQRPLLVEGDGYVEQWAAVSFRRGFTTEEALLFTHPVNEEPLRTIGYVMVRLTKERLNSRLRLLLLHNSLTASAFLALGLTLLYFFVRKMTRPLNRLTQSVRLFGTEGTAPPVPVETQDEIGKLAEAFNAMAESLRKRQEEKEQLEERLRHAAKMEAIGTLAGGVAHDFNNIITAMMGYITLLQKNLERPEVGRMYADKLLATTSRAANLTKRLLAFSRKQDIHPRPVDVNEVIRGVDELLTRIIGDDIAVHLNLHPEPLVVMIDAAQFDQVILNLATNARDAMPGGGILTITTEIGRPAAPLVRQRKGQEKQPFAVIRMRDTGAGIPDEVRDKIFDPFFSTKEVGKGTGLGLSMGYGIIKQHGGFIDVASEVGKGTEFSIYIPLVGGVAAAEGLPREAAQQRETVLVADDDDISRELARHILQEEGLEVVDAGDAPEAVVKFLEAGDRVRAVVMNMIMPGAQHAYAEMKKVRPELGAVFVGGKRTEAGDEEGDASLPFVYKPLQAADLLEKVRRVMRQDAPQAR